MPALNFSVPKLKPKILDGSKRQTIRRKRKRPIKVGDRLALWWEQCTPGREKLGESICTLLQDFEIAANGQVFVDQKQLAQSEALALAISDGFSSLEQMIDFFRDHYGLPFGNAVIIHWDPNQIK